jgi:hypothetical protein
MQTKNYFTKTILTLLTVVSFSVVAGAQFMQDANATYSNGNRIYSPDTRNKNIIDTAAIHTYCNLSKIFSSEAEREKCFISGGQAVVQNIPAAPVDLSQVNAHYRLKLMKYRVSKIDQKAQL